jgi:hypothetical protein
MAVLENGADADGERSAAGVALAETRAGGLAGQATDLAGVSVFIGFGFMLV